MKDGIEQFRAELVEKAVAAIGGVQANISRIEIGRAVVAAITEGWSATRQALPLLRSGGYVHDGDTLPDPGDQVGDYPMFGWTIRTAPREANPEERGVVDARKTLREWLSGDRKTPPPAGVRLEDLLDQNRWWVTKDKQAMRLTEMAPGHRANLLAMLERNALMWRDAINDRYAINAPDDVWREFERELARPEEVRRRAARKWLHDKPLVKRLRKLVKADRLLAEDD